MKSRSNWSFAAKRQISFDSFYLNICVPHIMAVIAMARPSLNMQPMQMTMRAKLVHKLVLACPMFILQLDVLCRMPLAIDLLKLLKMEFGLYVLLYVLLSLYYVHTVHDIN